MYSFLTLNFLKPEKFKVKILVFFQAGLFILSFLSFSGETNKQKDIHQYKQFFRTGEEALQAGKYWQAIKDYHKALKIAQNSAEGEKETLCLFRLGLLYWNVGKIEDSAAYYRKALAAAQKNSLFPQKIKIKQALEIFRLYVKAKELRSSGKIHQSSLYFKKAIQIARETGNKYHQIKCIRQLSVNSKPRKEKFFLLNKRAFDLARSVNCLREMGRCLNNMGIYYWKVNDYSRALSCFQEALDIARKQKDKRVEANCLNNLGIIYKQVGYYEKSLEYLKKALHIDREIGTEWDVSVDLNNIGITYRLFGLALNKKNLLDNSMNYYKKSLKLSNKNLRLNIKILNNIGNLYINLEDYIKSLKYFQKAYSKTKKIQNKESEGMLLNNLGRVHLRLENLEKAVNFFQQAIPMAEKTGGEHILWEAYFGLGQCYEKMNKISEAVSSYQNSISVVDSVRGRLFFDIYKAGYLRNKLKIYEHLLNLLFNQYSKQPSPELVEEIFLITEKANARAFLENLGKSRKNLLKRLNPDLKERENQISASISSIIHNLSSTSLKKKEREAMLDKLAQLEEEYLELIKKMRKDSPEVADMLFFKPSPLLQIRNRLLDKKTVLVEYFLGEQQSFIFLITKEETELYPLPGRKELKKSLKAYLKILSDFPRGRFRGIPAAQRLYRELLFPLEKIKDKSVNNLIIIPDGILYYLPFGTLIPDSQQKPTLRDCLLSSYNISYAPSASSLWFLSKKELPKKTSPSLLALGDPAYPVSFSKKEEGKKTPSQILKTLYQAQGFNISLLPHSKKEIKKIAKYFPEHNSQVFRGEEASEEAVKNLPLEEYKVIHFACHSLLDVKFPFRSALVLSLSREEKEDGFLQVREIWNLKLKANLVVLSTCQSGKGKLEKGEGVLGLPRVFFYAGAKSVVYSLWKIGDKPTARFMDYFYRFLREGGGKSQALRKAKLKMMETRYRHPFFWAPFILNGEGDTSIFNP